jgi:hypothetical protein
VLFLFFVFGDILLISESFFLNTNYACLLVFIYTNPRIRANRSIRYASAPVSTCAISVGSGISGVSSGSGCPPALNRTHSLCTLSSVDISPSDESV